MVRIWSRMSVIRRAKDLQGSMYGRMEEWSDGGMVFERDSLFRSDMAGDDP
jgi:hypothetical protein